MPNPLSNSTVAPAIPPQPDRTKGAVAQLYPNVARRKIPSAAANQKVLHAIVVAQRDHPTNGGFGPSSDPRHPLR